ncbi:cytochrome P450 [Striga asiatica]|uniref:Cytochrome P450 n=1 Tax=Striga asiatica TaxID=4170 RepID=A0A5A7R556_STRAF|nr:cytochrome P450 [Striga asiatica]
MNVLQKEFEAQRASQTKVNIKNKSTTPKAKHSKDEPEFDHEAFVDATYSREKLDAVAKKIHYNFEFDAYMSGMGIETPLDLKKEGERVIYTKSNAYIASEEVSSKFMSSKNDTKSPLESQAKGVDEDFSFEEKNVLKYIFDINHNHKRHYTSIISMHIKFIAN